jgi:hypothetical protein
MHGVVEADSVAGVWQPVEVTVMPMAKEATSKDRDFAFMFYGDQG